MIEGLIMLLIYAAVIAGVIYVVLYALGVIGVPLPGRVVQIVWLIFGLIVILWLFRLLVSQGGIPAL